MTSGQGERAADAPCDSDHGSGTKHLLRSCPLCGRDNRAVSPSRYSSGRWDIKTCADCGFVYLENPPDYAALIQEYDWSKTLPERQPKRREGSRLRSGVSLLLKVPKFRLRRGHHVKVASYVHSCAGEGRLLDVGCARGLVLSALNERFVPFGIEISPTLAKRADEVFRSRGGFVVCAPALKALDHFEADFFDIVVMRAYLEHELDPREILVKTVRVLRGGGKLIIKVPNYACLYRRVMGKTWCGFRYPDHVNYFTPRSLRSMLAAAGFEVVRLGLWYRWGLSDNLWLVARRCLPAESGGEA